ncbi:hypothetical protein BB560_002746 [Smittium megazygosporum]|uniref:Uncharacterized protein n=1 Tax=Smittium megazygosporum TaxID=133381 RepID=A0A2T9ZE13_9FUNG|nr:hypothetical protein BB560_002746 [Smittium megazygosporum]
MKIHDPEHNSRQSKKNALQNGTGLDGSEDSISNSKDKSSFNPQKRSYDKDSSIEVANLADEIDHTVSVFKKIKNIEANQEPESKKGELLDALNFLLLADVNKIDSLPSAISTKEDLFSMNKNLISMFPELDDTFDKNLGQSNSENNKTFDFNFINDAFFDQPNSDIVTKENTLLFENMLGQIQNSDIFQRPELYHTPNRFSDQTMISSPFSTELNGSLSSSLGNSSESISNNFISPSDSGIETNLTQSTSPKSTSNIDDIQSLGLNTDLTAGFTAGAGAKEFPESLSMQYNGLSNNQYARIDDLSSDFIATPETYNLNNTPGKNSYKFDDLSNNFTSPSQNLHDFSGSTPEMDTFYSESIPRQEQVCTNVLKLLTEVGITLSQSQLVKMQEIVVSFIKKKQACNPNLFNFNQNSAGLKKDLFAPFKKDFGTLDQNNLSIYQSNVANQNVNLFNNRIDQLSRNTLNSPNYYSNLANQGEVNLGSNDVFNYSSLGDSKLLNNSQPLNDSSLAYNPVNYNDIQKLLETPDFLSSTEPQIFNTNSNLASMNAVLNPPQSLNTSNSNFNDFLLEKAPEQSDWSIENLMKFDSPCIEDIVKADLQLNSSLTNQGSVPNTHGGPQFDPYSASRNYTTDDRSFDKFNKIQLEDQLGPNLNPSIVTSNAVKSAQVISSVNLFTHRSFDVINMVSGINSISELSSTKAGFKYNTSTARYDTKKDASQKENFDLGSSVSDTESYHSSYLSYETDSGSSDSDKDTTEEFDESDENTCDRTEGISSSSSNKNNFEQYKVGDRQYTRSELLKSVSNFMARINTIYLIKGLRGSLQPTPTKGNILTPEKVKFATPSSDIATKLPSKDTKVSEVDNMDWISEKPKENNKDDEYSQELAKELENMKI